MKVIIDMNGNIHNFDKCRNIYLRHDTIEINYESDKSSELYKGDITSANRIMALLVNWIKEQPKNNYSQSVFDIRYV